MNPWTIIGWIIIAAIAFGFFTVVLPDMMRISARNRYWRNVRKQERQERQDRLNRIENAPEYIKEIHATVGDVRFPDKRDAAVDWQKTVKKHGFVAAHPNDGWIDRENNIIDFTYTVFKLKEQGNIKIVSKYGDIVIK